MDERLQREKLKEFLSAADEYTGEYHRGGVQISARMRITGEELRAANGSYKVNEPEGRILFTETNTAHVNGEEINERRRRRKKQEWLRRRKPATQ